MREAEAYNYNIYLMVGTPYFLVACVAFFVYRGLRRKQLALLANSRPPGSPPSAAGSFRTAPDAGGRD